MVRPANFGWNSETSDSNSFQKQGSIDGDAVAEFDSVVTALRAASVAVMVAEDDASLRLPDAVFPNNWLSTHDGGVAVLYPMASPKRRLERRREILDMLISSYHIDHVVDMSYHEDEGRFLEGTGSLVLDRINRFAYACRSPRTCDALVNEWCARMDYRPLVFDAFCDSVPVYHTNVLLSVGTDWAAVCSAWIASSDRDRVLTALHDSGKTVLEATEAEAMGFGCNILELQAGGRTIIAGHLDLPSSDGRPYLEKLESVAGPLVGNPTPTIWSQGGGGIRCMICELFLEERH